MTSVAPGPGVGAPSNVSHTLERFSKGSALCQMVNGLALQKMKFQACEGRAPSLRTGNYTETTVHEPKKIIGFVIHYVDEEGLVFPQMFASRATTESKVRTLAPSTKTVH